MSFGCEFLLPHSKLSLCGDHDSFRLSLSSPALPLRHFVSVKCSQFLNAVSIAGDDGPVQPPERGGVGEAEAACAGEEALPGEPVAARRAGQHPAEAAEERAERGPAGGGEEAPGVHEPAQEVRRGRLAHCKTC